MLKSEIVYRELLESRGARLSQLGLSRDLGLSISTVNNALKPLRAMGAVKIFQRGLMVIDREKLLLYWASIRNLDRDIVFSTRVDRHPGDIEKEMPANVIYTAYSGYRFRFDSVPADYSEVYVYSDDPDEVARRFPFRMGPPNLFVLKMDRRLTELSEDGIAPNSQMFTDLWNIREWYAREFIKELGERING